MIYLDTSVALAHILSEDRRPPASLWDSPIISSRLLEYEIWARLNARDLALSHGDSVRMLLREIILVELVSPVLVRTLSPFPCPVRTLDALHLATLHFLHSRGQDARLATYDVRMAEAATSLGFTLADL